MMVQYVNGIFLLIGFVIAPLLCYGVCRWLLPRRWRCKIGVVGAAVIILLTAYGWTFGSQQLTVRPVTIVCSDLPQSFDGYRIVQFSDAHVGTMTEGSRWCLFGFGQSRLCCLSKGRFGNKSRQLPVDLRIRAPCRMATVAERTPHDTSWQRFAYRCRNGKLGCCQAHAPSWRCRQDTRRTAAQCICCYARARPVGLARAHTARIMGTTDP